MEVQWMQPSRVLSRRRRFSDGVHHAHAPAALVSTSAQVQSPSGSSPSASSTVCFSRVSPQAAPGMPRRVPSSSLLQSGSRSGTLQTNTPVSSVLFALPPSPRVPSSVPVSWLRGSEASEATATSWSRPGSGHRRIGGHVSPIGSLGTMRGGVASQSIAEAAAGCPQAPSSRLAVQRDSDNDRESDDRHNPLSLFEKLLSALMRPGSTGGDTDRRSDGRPSVAVGRGTEETQTTTLLGSGVLDASDIVARESTISLQSTSQTIADDSTAGTHHEDHQIRLLRMALRGLRESGRDATGEEDGETSLLLCEYREEGTPTRHAALDVTLTPRMALTPGEEGYIEERGDHETALSVPRSMGTTANGATLDSSLSRIAPLEEAVATSADAASSTFAATETQRLMHSTGTRLSSTAVASNSEQDQPHQDSRPGTAGDAEPLPWSVRMANALDFESTGPWDGGLLDVLRRLSVQDFSDDEDMATGVQRLRQLGTVLVGERLSDEEIEALPKVRFEQTEMQRCSICLEAYQQGVLLTRLPCGHFFHVACLKGWMQCATRCPLCRGRCVDRG
eukprot:TRINITY_DN67729_c0_g1_i1.p1 TRINITY_DN67729_c0_g1~~TRINITY_DN67729_c0_g1_i1.p1  ORF type:complete len:563 (+),score=87.05 TRINITY_DN67729_c0_g1_i1:65-1753(+)